MAMNLFNHDREPVSANLEILRDYANRVINGDEVLSPGEEAYKEALFQEFAEVGGSYRMTEREMVSLMLRGVFSEAPPCWCSSCRAEFLESEKD